MKLFATVLAMFSIVYRFCSLVDCNDSNNDIITVIQNMQKDINHLSDFVHSRLDKKIDSIEQGIQDLKKEAGFFTKKLITADDVISATSSSVWCGDLDMWGPQYAWRGRSKVSYHFFHSADEMKPWLLIQIPRVQLYSVTIINRKDGGGEELRNVQVRAGLVKGIGNELVGMFKGPGVTGKEHIIRFSKGVAVEYISFQKMEKGRLMINGIKVNELL